MPLWALRLRDFDILNIYYDEFKIEKMVKFETLIVPRGLMLMIERKAGSDACMVHTHDM